MKYDDFESCADSLREIRAQLHNDLDPSILAELDSVIERLESGPYEQISDSASRAKAVDDALMLLGRIIEVVVGAHDLISRFWY